MRITGGKHGSRKLISPAGDAVRPTSDKVRQAVFNMLNSRGWLHDAIVIDAFCGTGALGLEALSQGAKFCTFFDKNKKSIDLCRANIAALKEKENSQIIFQDITKVKLNEGGLANLVFLDPPYHQELVFKAIQSLKNEKYLSLDCNFVIETAKDEIIDCCLIDITDEKVYGDTKIIFAKVEN